MQESLVTWEVVCEKLCRDIATQKLRIIIPTMNAEDYIDIVLDYYAEIGIPVTVFIDSKSEDSTKSKVDARHVDTMVLNNPSPVVEAMIKELSVRSETEWVLRIDDDELPSKAMLAYVQQMLSDKATDSVGFPRLQCVVSETAKLKASKRHSPTAHTQWRLYRPAKVPFTTEIHTPGFIPDAKSSVVAPIEATMIHLDWSLHSYESRQAKVKRYDAHSDGLGSAWMHFYLWEDDKKHGQRNLINVNLPEFVNVASSIRNRLPQNCTVESADTNWLKTWITNFINPSSR